MLWGSLQVKQIEWVTTHWFISNKVSQICLIPRSFPYHLHYFRNLLLQLIKSAFTSAFDFVYHPIYSLVLFVCFLPCRVLCLSWIGGLDPEMRIKEEMMGGYFVLSLTNVIVNSSFLDTFFFFKVSGPALNTQSSFIPDWQQFRKGIKQKFMNSQKFYIKFCAFVFLRKEFIVFIRFFFTQSTKGIFIEVPKL